VLDCLDGWRSFAVRDFEPNGIVLVKCMHVLDIITVAKVTLLREFESRDIYGCMRCYNCCHGNAAKEFWALWDNIYDCVFTRSNFR
jgi:hypothetical protein